jgi:hypothetical protein|tara:strand:- start:713 stop:1318 length:606 start_codon:yes stop_codon:yes gene_type:complete
MAYSHTYYSAAPHITEPEAKSKIKALSDHLTVKSATALRKGDLGNFGDLTPQQSEELMKLLQQHPDDADFNAIRRKAVEDYDTKLVNSKLSEMVMGTASTDNGETHPYLLRVDREGPDHVDLYLALLAKSEETDFSAQGIHPLDKGTFKVAPIEGRGEKTMRNRILPVVYHENGFSDVVGDGWFFADEKRHLRHVKEFLVD